MTDQLQKAIRACNLLPANRAAAEALRRMGETPDQSQLHVLQLAQAKAESEGRTPPDDVTDDLYDLKQGMSPDWARKITDRMTEEETDADSLEKADAQTLLDWMSDALPLDQFSQRALREVPRD